MKKILLSLALAFGLFSTVQAQDMLPCYTDQKNKELFDNLSPQEQIQFKLDRQSYEAEIQEYISNHPELLASSNSRGTITYTIPVVFHILHVGGPENISDEQVLNALNHMNEDFQKLNSNWANVNPAFLDIVADVEIEFKLAKLDKNGNCTNGITRTLTPVSDGGNGQQRVAAVKAAHGDWPGDMYINIFVFKTMDVAGAAGYTYTPNTWIGSDMGNGIHLIHNYVGSIGTAGSQGAHTLTHEVGHWLNLSHPWGSSNEPGAQSNCEMDDGVSDTPNTIGWQTCNLSGTSCGSLDNVENFMEYSYCSKMFTNGQKARMHAALGSSVGGRNQIHKATNLTATGVNLPEVLCEADFDADYKVVCQGQPVTYTDRSHSGVISREWTFEGGNPATSTNESPSVTYDAPGIYEVELTVSDGSNSKTETKTSFIQVLNDGITLPFIEGFEAATTLANTEWRVENKGGNAKFEVVTDVAHTGNNAVGLKNFGQPKGNIDAIVSAPIDLSTIQDEVTLSFRYAYRKRSASNSEKLIVYLSSTCGETWAQRKTLTGNLLGTDVASSTWKPASKDDWVTVHMTNVTSSFWVDNFLMKFEFESDGGNNIYLDDINIYSGSSDEEPLNTIENELIQSFSVYPNPTNNVANVSFSVQNSQKANVSLVNMMGQNILMNVIQASKGENVVMLNTENVEAGVYFVKVNIGGIQQTKRLIIK